MSKSRTYYAMVKGISPVWVKLKGFRTELSARLFIEKEMSDDLKNKCRTKWRYYLKTPKSP